MFEDIIIREFNKDDRAKVDEFFINLDGEARAFFNRNDGNYKKL